MPADRMTKQIIGSHRAGPSQIKPINIPPRPDRVADPVSQGIRRSPISDVRDSVSELMRARGTR